MPSDSHDLLEDFFEIRPALAVEILTLLNVDLPIAAPVGLLDRTFKTRSFGLEADKVIRVGPPQDPTHGIIVEIQLKWDTRKREQIPRYAAALWLRMQRPVTVLIICPDAAAAARYRQPIPTALPGYTFQPLVLGPEEIPVMTDPDEVAAHPEMAAMGIIAHGPDRKAAEAFARGLAGHEHAQQYYEHAHGAATPAVRHLLEEAMKGSTWVVSTPFAREHFGRGKAEALLTVLAARGLEVSAEEREYILSCTDIERLETWIERAVVATSTTELFR